jgi:hypothetical protein
VYAISVFNLEGSEWTRSISPTATVANAIFIYDFRKAS